MMLDVEVPVITVRLFTGVGEVLDKDLIIGERRKFPEQIDAGVFAAVR
jgi:hypothetical protein